MKIQIGSLPVYFPYDRIYPEQYEYMVELYRVIHTNDQSKSNKEKRKTSSGMKHGTAMTAMFEMPRATGHLTCMLSLICSLLFHERETTTRMSGNWSKLVFCTNSVIQMEKVMEECKFVYQYIKKHVVVANEGAMVDDDLTLEYPDLEAGLTAVGFSSKKNLCIHPSIVIDSPEDSRVDAQCRSITASWIREAARSDPTLTTCSYYDGWEQQEKTNQFKLPFGVHTIHDLHAMGRKEGWCPYFTTKKAVQYADIVVYCYSNLLDPKISSTVSNHLSKECIVVFDDAYKIDTVSSELFSVHVDEPVLRQIKQGIRLLENRVQSVKDNEMGTRRLQEEYQRLVSGLSPPVEPSDELPALPIRTIDLLPSYVVPGNIRQPEHFVVLLKRFFGFIHGYMTDPDMKHKGETADNFVELIQREALIEENILKYFTHRLNSLLNALQIRNTYEYRGVRILSDLATMLGSQRQGFYVTVDPYDDRTPTSFDPVLQLTCLDPAFALVPSTQKFKMIVFQSSVLPAMSMYAKLLSINPIASRSFPFTYPRNCLCPVVLSRGSDQVAVSTQRKARLDPSVVRNYGALLVELSKYTPDGIVAFFPSFHYMEEMLARWNDMGLITTIQRFKLVVAETTSPTETALALQNYRRACDSGRGALMFSIARGSVADSVDFDGKYGRAVVMFGIPFSEVDTKLMKAKLDLFERKYNISAEDYLTFDALRHTSHCITKGLHNKRDYGLAILADRRYNKEDKRRLLPRWVQDQTPENHLNLSTEALMQICRRFLKEIAQPIDMSDVQMLTEQDINLLSKKIHTE